jgi:hypothetical protein
VLLAKRAEQIAHPVAAMQVGGPPEDEEIQFVVNEHANRIMIYADMLLQLQVGGFCGVINHLAIIIHNFSFRPQNHLNKEKFAQGSSCGNLGVTDYCGGGIFSHTVTRLFKHFLTTVIAYHVNVQVVLASKADNTALAALRESVEKQRGGDAKVTMNLFALLIFVCSSCSLKATSPSKLLLHV